MQLRWVRDNQKTFRAEWYSGVLDALDSNTGDIGQRVILPPTYTGSPRDMHQRYHDAMALVQKYGKPDLFITMTCNPNWEEIQRELRPGQQAQDRPDLTTRVFHSKFEEMKTDLFTKGVLGKVVAHVHVIKFQKRGLPHAHILIILNERDKLRSPDDYDRIVRAEIPDPNVEPELYASVLKHMIHMPCALSADSICKKDGKCKKRFPKPFAPETLEGQNSYPVYRRRNDGREVTLSNGKVVNNSWVVPYNPWLLKKYESYQCGDLFKYTICEIFVQICL
ncbi:hypothetical protein MKW98_029742 [Papaver atlanticum]|uniref:Helitron helicase-like domain-containing protein n=1 Tax=Papaver atlanticum TaxID=357466 RepID=A0AAD4XR73_9MAGN|nr:hypothetical protein MKW98_029742 [Papaver atlanticum]